MQRLSTPRAALRGFLATTLLLSSVIAASHAQAHARRFTYTHESGVEPAGEFEYEQWVTLKAHKDSDGDFEEWTFRHEFEFGVTDRFQLALYLADWRYSDGKSVEDPGFAYLHSAIEAKYQMTDPKTQPVGSALYGEVYVGEELLKLEGKLILDTRIRDFVAAYNLTVESEWEGSGLQERTGEIKNNVGVSWKPWDRFAVGAEAYYEIELEDWSEAADGVVYAGPAVSYSGDHFWVAVSGLFQLTGVEDEVDFQTRLIVGVEF